MKNRNRIGLALCAGFGLLLLVTPVGAQNANNPKKHKPVEPAVGTLPEDMTPEAAEVVWLHHHNASSDAILRYINHSHANFKLSVRDVNYLKDIGVSTDIVFAMVRTPEARENVVRLRSREPHWHVAKNGKKETEAPQNALENSETLATPVMDVEHQDNVVPNYYGPANYNHYRRVPPQGYPYNAAPPIYNGYGNPNYGAPGYNGLNPNYQQPVPNAQPIVPR